MTFQLSVPSKTFLLGEYLALQTGEALVATTGPRFQLRAQLINDVQPMPFHPASPAGKLFPQGGKFSIEFLDPHDGRGGFGRSTAEFLFALFLRDFHSILITEASTAWTPQAVMKAYRECAKSSPGLQPSGADVMAQLSGGVVSVAAQKSKSDRMDWFSDLKFSIFHTGAKLATHAHLESLDGLETSDLRPVYIKGLQALKDGDSSQWLDSVKEYRSVLRSKKLEADLTTEALEMMLRNPNVLAAKGCGAMGADVILCFHRPDKSSLVRNHAEDIGLRYVNDSNGLEAGFRFEV